MGGLYSSILSFTLLSHRRNYRVQRTRSVEFAQLHKYNSNFHFAVVSKRFKKQFHNLNGKEKLQIDLLPCQVHGISDGMIYFTLSTWYVLHTKQVNVVIYSKNGYSTLCVKTMLKNYACMYACWNSYPNARGKSFSDRCSRPHYDGSSQPTSQKQRVWQCIVTAVGFNGCVDF